MAVWLRHGPCTVGLDQGLVRAADFAQLATMSDAVAALDRHVAELSANAQADAEQLVADASAEAEQIRAAAIAQEQLGYEAGLERGARDAQEAWAQRAVDEAQLALSRLERQKERLRDIVSLAVERVIGQTDRKALFERALATISKLVKDTPLLTLRVSESDSDSARDAVRTMLEEIGGGPQIEVISDANLAVGSCLFESDLGLIDAGLKTQLAAIRRAVGNAAQQIVRIDETAPTT